MSTLKSTLSPILRQAIDTKALTGSFLNAEDLSKLSRSCKHFQFLFQNEMTKKKQARELLSHVFNADPEKVKEILDNQQLSIHKIPHKTQSKTSISYGHGCLVLTRSSYKEEYYKGVKYSRREEAHREKMTFERTWKNISPLEAAAWCGDIFLVRDLLNYYVPKTLSHHAAMQLQGILDRKETKENGEFLAPFKKFLKDYENYFTINESILANHYSRPFEEALIDTQWSRVFQSQRRLPIYGLQQFCVEKPHSLEMLSSDKAYNTEPKRAFHRDTIPKDFYDIPYGCAVYKGFSGSILWSNGWRVKVTDDQPMNRDFKAISRICEVRTQDLVKIIENLKEHAPLCKV